MTTTLRRRKKRTNPTNFRGGLVFGIVMPKDPGGESKQTRMSANELAAEALTGIQFQYKHADRTSEETGTILHAYTDKNGDHRFIAHLPPGKIGHDLLEKIQSGAQSISLEHDIALIASKKNAYMIKRPRHVAVVEIPYRKGCTINTVLEFTDEADGHHAKDWFAALSVKARKKAHESAVKAFPCNMAGKPLDLPPDQVPALSNEIANKFVRARNLLPVEKTLDTQYKENNGKTRIVLNNSHQQHTKMAEKVEMNTELDNAPVESAQQSTPAPDTDLTNLQKYEAMKKKWSYVREALEPIEEYLDDNIRENFIDRLGTDPDEERFGYASATLKQYAAAQKERKERAEETKIKDAEIAKLKEQLQQQQEKAKEVATEQTQTVWDAAAAQILKSGRDIVSDSGLKAARNKTLAANLAKYLPPEDMYEVNNMMSALVSAAQHNFSNNERADHLLREQQGRWAVQQAGSIFESSLQQPSAKRARMGEPTEQKLESKSAFGDEDISKFVPQYSSTLPF